MIWPLRTCFSARGFALVAMCLPCLFADSVSGHVVLKDSRGDRSGVAIWLEPKNRPARPPGKADMRARMLQKDKRFTPHVLAVEVGTTVDFPNQDPIFHNAFSNFSGKVFDIGLYPPGTSRAIKFDRPGVVRIFCNIHPAMSAVIVVVDTPYFAITSADGAFRVNDAPPGEYALGIFHERATPEVLHALERRVNVRGAVELPAFSIAEAGYIPLPHKNKYGKEYPPQFDERGGYKAGQ